MDKKNIIIIVIALVILVVGSFIIFYYIADYPFEDERIKISVPAQTSFNITATTGGGWTIIRYNSSDENNIIIDLMKPGKLDASVLGVELDLYGITKNVMVNDLTENKGYKIETVRENYTVYFNLEKNNFIALLFDDEKEVIVMISCDDSHELISKLAGSFVLKSFTTEGLKIENVQYTESNTATNNTTTVQIENNSSSIT